MEIFLSNQLFIYLFSEGILFVLNIVALLGSLSILKSWDFNSTKPKQYKLEKRTYLIVLIILFSLIFKVSLLPYFAYTIDSLSSIVPGAMCGAGVISANEYGNILLFLKIIILFFIGIWLIINKMDQDAYNYPFIKTKFWFFSIIFVLLTFEFVLELIYFSNISLLTSVKCCSVIFGVTGDAKIPFGLSTVMLLVIFYLLYILNIVLSFQKNSLLLFASSLLFLYFAYLGVENFFGTYIYELPTHKCPFCMLQKEYFYIGYFLWGTLFLAIFFGVSNFVLKLLIKVELEVLYKYSRIFNTIFVILSSAYPLAYYIKNGVWL